MIDLHYAPTPNGWKISIMLEELGLRYTVVPVNIRAGEQFRPEFLAISPNNRIPAIVDHAPADGELLLERLRNVRSGRRHDDGVEGCRFRNAQIPVGVLESHVGHAQFAQIAPRLGQYGLQSFDGIHLRGKPCQHGGLVAAAGADFKHFRHVGAGQQQFRHACHDERLGNRLPESDR